MKLIGVCCIIAACGGMGFGKGAELSMELSELQELRKIFFMLRSEVDYTKAPLGEAFDHISGRTEGNYHKWLCFLSERLEQKGGQSFREIWEEAELEIRKELHLRKEQRELLRNLGTSLGCYDRELEIGAIDLYLEQLGQSIQQLQQEIPEKRRLFRCLGVMSGIFVAVVLL